MVLLNCTLGTPAESPSRDARVGVSCFYTVQMALHLSLWATSPVASSQFLIKILHTLQRNGFLNSVQSTMAFLSQNGRRDVPP